MIPCLIFVFIHQIRLYQSSHPNYGLSCSKLHERIHHLHRNAATATLPLGAKKHELSIPTRALASMHPHWHSCITFIWRELERVGPLGSPPTGFRSLCCWRISQRFSESPVNCSRTVRSIVSGDVGEFDVARGGARSGDLRIVVTNPKVHRMGLFAWF